jgi:CPA2 family monovalent cation:H+ antiporter-2
VRPEQRSDIFLILALALGVGVAAIAIMLAILSWEHSWRAGLSESDYDHEIMGICSLRDTFVVLFFVAVGHDGKPASLWTTGSFCWFSCFFIIPVSGRLFSPYRLCSVITASSIYVGIGLVQTGEFSIVLANLGLSGN